MGSSSESSSGANKYGNYSDLYDCEKCKHDKDQKEVKVIRWISIPMTNSFIYLWITLSRIPLMFSIGNVCNGKNFTHDCIEAFIKCKVCGKISYYTLEYSSSGRKIRGGKYQFYVKDEGVFEYEPENMNLQDLYDVFDKVQFNISGKDYDISERNCKHYAESICHFIYKGFYEIDEKKRNNGYTFHEKVNATYLDSFLKKIIKK